MFTARLMFTEEEVKELRNKSNVSSILVWIGQFSPAQGRPAECTGDE
jgi:hypothetical protein